MQARRVVTSFLYHAGRILVLRRSQRVSTYRGRWAGVSGSIEEGRSPLEQALQEVQEETGLAPEDLRLLCAGEPLDVKDRQAGRLWRVYPFLFEIEDPDRIRLDWEHTEARWIMPQELEGLETVPRLKETWQRVAEGLPGRTCSER